VSAIYRKEELFHGDNLKWAPDLTVIMRDLAYITRQGYEFTDRIGELFADPNTFESGSHREMGVVIASGPSFENLGRLPEAASLMDIAPTVLHLNELPVPTSMDGTVRLEWLEPGARKRKIRRDDGSDNGEQQFARDEGSALHGEDDSALWDHLRSLGYVE
jgi:hypothetical protein